MAKLVQVRLKAVTVQENGYWENHENVIAFTLVYPREGTPVVCTARKVRLTSGERLDFAAEMHRRGQPHDDLLFRETVWAESPLVSGEDPPKNSPNGSVTVSVEWLDA